VKRENLAAGKLYNFEVDTWSM